MSMNNVAEYNTDLTVIGGGVAGLFAAIEASKKGIRVALITKGKIARSGSSINAYNRIQSPLGYADERDNPDVFCQDIIQAGCNLSNYKLVRAITQNSLKPIKVLEKLGVPFDKGKDGRLIQLDLVAAATYPRVLSMQTVPLAGPSILRALEKQIIKETEILIFEDTFVIDLISNKDTVNGCIALDIRTGEIITISSNTIILATGALSECYPYSYCPPDTSGDGQAIALRAGAKLVDMEFTCFYEAVAYPPSIKGLNLHSLQFYNIGAKPVYNIIGEEIDQEFEGDHLSRNILRAQIQQGKTTSRGGVYFDLNNIKRKDFYGPGRFEASRYLPQLGITKVELGLGPLMNNGGILVDENCESTLKGLYAAGDVIGGLVGARYLGATGLIFAMSSGIIAGNKAADKSLHLKGLQGSNRLSLSQVNETKKFLCSLINETKGKKPYLVKNQLQETMYTMVGPLREQGGLKRGLEKLNDLIDSKLYLGNKGKIFNNELTNALQLKNMLTLSRIIAMVSIMREETRGDFVRTDYPQTNNQCWLKNITTHLKKDSLEIKAVPVQRR